MQVSERELIPNCLSPQLIQTRLMSYVGRIFLVEQTGLLDGSLAFTDQSVLRVGVYVVAALSTVDVADLASLILGCLGELRSEERRVGKECVSTCNSR